MTQNSPAHRALVASLTVAQDHVLAAIDGLPDDQLRRAVAPSGWSAVSLLSHLTYDDEIFWCHAILAGERAAIDALRDGWQSAPDDIATAVARYRAAVAHTRQVLATSDLDQPPAWWPPADVFPFPAFETGWQCAHRLLAETSTHAGHLDVVRELIDGHQHLVVG